MSTDQGTAPLDAPLSAWLALSYSPDLGRAVEIALVGDHSLRVFGHPFNGRRHFLALRRDLEQQLPGHLSRPWVWRFPCPCGNLGDPVHACSCTALALERRKLRTGLVAFDLNLDVPRPYEPEMHLRSRSEPLEQVLTRTAAARALRPCIDLDDLEDAYQPLAFAVRRHNLHLEQREAVARVALSVAALAAVHRNDRCVVSAADVTEAIQFQTQYRHGRS